MGLTIHTHHHLCAIDVYACIYLPKASLFFMPVMSQENVPVATAATASVVVAALEPSGYKCRHLPLSTLRVNGSMFAAAPLNRTPMGIPMTTEYRFNPRGNQSTVGDDVNGCCLEPLQSM